jgi:hypothetical protein
MIAGVTQQGIPLAIQPSLGRGGLQVPALCNPWPSSFVDQRLLSHPKRIPQRTIAEHYLTCCVCFIAFIAHYFTFGLFRNFF